MANTTTVSRRTFGRCLLAAMGLPLLNGCALAVVGGTAATTTVIATDRRTAGEQLDDQTIELRVSSEMDRAFGDRARVLGTSYAGRLLLVGDVPTEADRARAESIARTIPKVTQVDNYLRVGDITPLSVRTNDTWLTSKVKAQMIATEDVPSRTIKVTTERGVVYLMGKVTHDEAERAAIVAASVSGVNKVVKLFRIVSRESILAEPGQAAGQVPATSNTTSSGTPASPAATEGTGAQTMPIR